MKKSKVTINTVDNVITDLINEGDISGALKLVASGKASRKKVIFLLKVYLGYQWIDDVIKCLDELNDLTVIQDLIDYCRRDRKNEYVDELEKLLSKKRKENSL